MRVWSLNRVPGNSCLNALWGKGCMVQILIPDVLSVGLHRSGHLSEKLGKPALYPELQDQCRFPLP